MEASQIDISRLERLTKEVGQMVSEVNGNVNRLDGKVESLQSELEALRQDFIEMTRKQQRTAAIQKATTELVRVRQEIQQKFGNYSVVRETMIGILQATDVALVKETTVSRVSEELMISTPRYWLAPCLVALAAWISNDHALAERAIAESMKRDIKKTAITMALICRRNGRRATCFEWLDVYFQNVAPESVSEEDFAYVNAYASGVFGIDESHVCDEYISMWVEKVSQISDGLKERESRNWKEYCARYKTDITSDYNALKEVPEFSRINDYVGRLEAVTTVQNEFNVLGTENIDLERLRAEVDQRLEELINRVEKEEYELRDQERFFSLMKIDGDEDKARRTIEEENLRRDQDTLNLIERASDILRNSDNQADRKAALSLVTSFANNGMREYIEEANMPETVTIKQDGWEAVVGNQTDLNSVCQNYAQHMNQEAYNEKMKINAETNTSSIVGAAVAGILGIIFLFVAWPLGIAGIGVAAYFGYKAAIFNTTKQNRMAEVDKNYQERMQEGFNNIQETGNQYRQVCYRVYEIYNGKSNVA